MTEPAYTFKTSIRYYRIGDATAWIKLEGKKGQPPDQYLRPHRRGSKDMIVYAKGGKTEVVITLFDEDGDPVKKFTAVSYCSLQDNFCYKIGREIALGRARKQMEYWLNPPKQD